MQTKLHIVIAQHGVQFMLSYDRALIGMHSEQACLFKYYGATVMFYLSALFNTVCMYSTAPNCNAHAWWNKQCPVRFILQCAVCVCKHCLS